MPPDEPKIATYRAKWDEEYRKRWGLENQFAEGLEAKLDPFGVVEPLDPEDETLADVISSLFVECLVAPSFSAATTAPSTSSGALTRPGIAASGHWVQHWAQPVQLAAMKSGTSIRTPLMSRTVPVAAGMALIAAKGSAIPS